MPANFIGSKRRALMVAAVLTLLLVVTPSLMGGTLYIQTNIVSNSSATPASFTDSNLINPWGNVSNGGSPFWVSDQGTGLSTLYSTPPGTPQSLVVRIPGGNPTGIVANNAGFNVNGSPAFFIFATLGGTIAGWNGTPTLGNAVTEAAVPGAVFTGLAQNSSGTFLYASDFKNGKIDVFNSTYTQVSLSGSFTDPNLPAGYSPYNIQLVNGRLYAEYAPIGPNGQPMVGPGNG